MLKAFFWYAAVVLVFSCRNPAQSEAVNYEWFGEEVIVSAYNSVSWQTDGDPNITAWGDTLKPGLKAVAVSRDLLNLGLKHNTMVRIDTFPDTFLVKDKMNRRWRKRMDIYMGTDVKKAREWGRKKLMICYALPLRDSLTQPIE